MMIKLLRWLIFGVLFSLAPLAASYLILLLKHKTHNIENIAGDGGLFLILSAISAGSVGELIGTGKDALFFKLISSRGAVMTLFVSSFLFAAILEEKLTSDFDGCIVADASVVIFVIGILPCAACIALSEL